MTSLSLQLSVFASDEQTYESLLCCAGLLLSGCLSHRLEGVSVFTCKINFYEGMTWLLKSGRRAQCLKKQKLGYVLHDHRIPEALIGFSLGFFYCF